MLGLTRGRGGAIRKGPGLKFQEKPKETGEKSHGDVSSGGKTAEHGVVKPVSAVKTSATLVIFGGKATRKGGRARRGGERSQDV